MVQVGDYGFVVDQLQDRLGGVKPLIVPVEVVDVLPDSKYKVRTVGGAQRKFVATSIYATKHDAIQSLKR